MVFGMNVIDEERLIEEVRSRPILWDKTHPHYPNSTKKSNEWESIAKSFKQDKNVIKNKWRSLLTKFRKEEKLANAYSSGDGLKDAYQSNWIFYESMKFLDDSVASKPSTGNLDSIFEDNFECIEKEINSAPKSALKPFLPQPTINKMDKGGRAHKFTTSTSVPDVSNDMNMLFFTTILPYVEQIPPTKILEYRNIISELTQIYAYPNHKWDNLLALLKIPNEYLDGLINSKKDDDDIVFLGYVKSPDRKKKNNRRTEIPIKKEIKTEPAWDTDVSNSLHNEENCMPKETACSQRHSLEKNNVSNRVPSNESNLPLQPVYYENVIQQPRSLDINPVHQGFDFLHRQIPLLPTERYMNLQPQIPMHLRTYVTAPPDTNGIKKAILLCLHQVNRLILNYKDKVWICHKNKSIVIINQKLVEEFFDYLQHQS